MNMNTNQAHIKYFEALLDNSIVSKSDLEGNITYVNDNFIETLGFSKEECINHNHSILRHPDTPDLTFKIMWKTIKSGQIFRERLLSKKRDGSDFWSETSIIPLIDEDSNTIIEYMAIRRDITDFLEIKKQIARQKIKEEEQKKINEAKDSFLLLFTHELKTPLNSIINFCKYINEKGCENIPKDKRKKLLDQIELNAFKMLKDVTQLLELSKLKSNRLTYNMSIFNIEDTLNDVIEEHMSLAREHHISVSSCLYTHKYYTKNDIYRFKQIISNILSNAIKYSNSKVYVHVKSKSDRCNIIIADDGKGIKNKDKVFDLFEQDENEEEDKKGTGIGLSFVKHLCKDLNIKYTLENSKELGGLSFRLTIKLIKGKS